VVTASLKLVGLACEGTSVTDHQGPALARGLTPQPSVHHRGFPARARAALLGAALAVAMAVVAMASSPANAAGLCTRPAAKRALTHTAFVHQVHRRLRPILGPGRRVLGVFVVQRPQCRDLTGDGTREMVVSLACCTVSSPDPWAIFMRRRGRWRLAFSRIRTDNWGVTPGNYESDYANGPSRMAVEEKLPVYGASDALCCPRSFSYKYIVWNGRRFVYGVRW